jgi:hypothetical protein
MPNEQADADGRNLCRCVHDVPADIYCPECEADAGGVGAVEVQGRRVWIRGDAERMTAAMQNAAEQLARSMGSSVSRATESIKKFGRAAAAAFPKMKEDEADEADALRNRPKNRGGVP